MLHFCFDANLDAVMPDAPDVFIVRDATKDPRFQNNPLVTGSPFIRFYAGASLILDDVKVISILNLSLFLFLFSSFT